MQYLDTIKNSYFVNFISQNKVLGFFLCLFFISISLIFTTDEDDETRDKIGIEIPNLEIQDFSFYHIHENSLDIIAKGKELKKYKNHEELFNTEIQKHTLQDNKQKYIEKFNAPHVISKDNAYIFPHSVNYKRDDGIYFYSQKGVYSHKNGIFKGEGEFNIKSDELNANGQNINYNTKNKNLQTQQIKAKIKLRTTNENN